MMSGVLLLKPPHAESYKQIAPWHIICYHKPEVINIYTGYFNGFM